MSRRFPFELLNKNSQLAIPLLLVIIFSSLLILFFESRGFNILPSFEKESVNAQEFPEAVFLKEKNWDFKQLSIYFTQVAEKKGAAYAFNVLKIAEVPPNTDLHLLAHVVGDILYRQKGVQGIKVCTDDFRNACSHSIVVGVYKAKGEKGLEEIGSACKSAPGGKNAYGMCYHGLGHGFLASVDYEMKKAVELCQKLNPSSRTAVLEISECIGGVTMEMVFGVNDIQTWEKQKPTYFKKDEPLYPCISSFIPTDYQSYCLVYITPYLFEAAGGDPAFPTPTDFQNAFNFCLNLPKQPPANRDSCFGGFGKEFIVLVQNRDIRRIEDLTEDQLRTVSTWCLFAKDSDGILQCNLTALRSLYWGGENNPEVAERFCSVLEGSYQTLCFNDLISSVHYFSSSNKEIERFCSRLDNPYKNACLKYQVR